MNSTSENLSHPETSNGRSAEGNCVVGRRSGEQPEAHLRSHKECGVSLFLWPIPPAGAPEFRTTSRRMAGGSRCLLNKAGTVLPPAMRHALRGSSVPPARPGHSAAVRRMRGAIDRPRTAATSPLGPHLSHPILQDARSLAVVAPWVCEVETPKEKPSTSISTHLIVIDAHRAPLHAMHSPPVLRLEFPP